MSILVLILALCLLLGLHCHSLSLQCVRMCALLLHILLWHFPSRRLVECEGPHHGLYKAWELFEWTEHSRMVYP